MGLRIVANIWAHLRQHYQPSGDAILIICYMAIYQRHHVRKHMMWLTGEIMRAAVAYL
jgi:hypothetical protein